MHRSVLKAMQYAGMNEEQQLLASIASASAKLDMDNAEHTLDPVLMTESEEEKKVWAYVTTQYNLNRGCKNLERMVRWKQ